jgi:hypothetical protein
MAFLLVMNQCLRKADVKQMNFVVIIGRNWAFYGFRLNLSSNSYGKTGAIPC